MICKNSPRSTSHSSIENNYVILWIDFVGRSDMSCCILLIFFILYFFIHLAFSSSSNQRELSIMYTVNFHLQIYSLLPYDTSSSSLLPFLWIYIGHDKSGTSFWQKRPIDDDQAQLFISYFFSSCSFLCLVMTWLTIIDGIRRELNVNTFDDLTILGFFYSSCAACACSQYGLWRFLLVDIDF